MDNGLVLRDGAPGPAMSVCPGTVGDSMLEAMWSNELALETASSVVA